MSKLQVLLTGSTGFVGQYFISNYKNHHDFKSVNLRKIQLDQILSQGIDTILHSAALAHQIKDVTDDASIKINTKYKPTDVCGQSKLTAKSKQGR